MSAKSSDWTVVTFTYDLPKKFDIHDEFRGILEGLGWQYSISNVPLPRTTCIRVFQDSITETQALEFSQNEIRSVVRQIEQLGSNYSGFRIERYYFVSHKTPPSLGSFGVDLG
jgi:hypothetical protein